MASYTIVVRAGGSGLEGQLNDIMANMMRIDSIMDQLADEDVLPILAEHYDKSGIKQGGSRSGDLREAITKRGASGNVISKQPGKLIVGVDYAVIPYAKWVLEGRGEVRPKAGKKVLHWIDPDTGKDVFAKRVGPAPAHPVYYLLPEELTQLEGDLVQKLKTRSGG